MSQLRRKTVAAEAREYLLKARELGVPLSWNRYEAMQPQDGFARLGLCCYDCLLGPCRLNPFETKEQKTVCGLGKEDLAARGLLRLLRGKPGRSVWDAAQALCAAEAKALYDLPVIPGERQVGLGALQYGYVNILAEGVPAKALTALKEAAVEHEALAIDAGANGFAVALAGDILPQLDLPAACTEGTVEFAILTGLADAYVVGTGATALGRNAAASLQTVVVTAESGFDAAACLAAAAEAYKKRDAALTQVELAVETVPVADGSSLRKKIAAADRVALLGGGSTLKLTVDELAVKSAQVFSGNGVLCLAFGNEAVALAKSGLENDNIVFAGSNAMMPAIAGLLGDKKTVALMPELSKGHDLATALVLGNGGVPVLTATELPIEGAAALAAEIHARVAFAAPEDYLAAAVELLGAPAFASV